MSPVTDFDAPDTLWRRLVRRLVATSLIIYGVLMARRGRKRMLDVESEYWRPLLSGVAKVEPCRRLEIGRKTGYRWRAENGGWLAASTAGRAGPLRSISIPLETATYCHP